MPLDHDCGILPVDDGQWYPFILGYHTTRNHHIETLGPHRRNTASMKK